MQHILSVTYKQRVAIETAQQWPLLSSDQSIPADRLSLHSLNQTFSSHTFPDDFPSKEVKKKKNNKKMETDTKREEQKVQRQVNTGMDETGV